VSLLWRPDADTRISVVASAVLGNRSSVAVGGFATQADTATAAGVWSPRQVDIDHYNSQLLELRVLRDLRVGTRSVKLAGGLAITDNDMWRRQRGVGTRASDYDLTVQGAFARDLHYLTSNVAGYAEAAVSITPAWTVVPGIRVERGETRMRGTLAYYDPANTPRDLRHSFPLLGLRSSLRVSPSVEWYGGWSQAYRPMILKDVLPESATERTDTNLADAKGWTLESGVRGEFGTGISYDVGGFSQRYANRFGLLAMTDSLGNPFIYKTNVGTSQTYGIEARIAAGLGEALGAQWRGFTATSLTDARYVAGSVAVSGANVSVKGHEVESAPRIIARGGLTAMVANASATAQLSYVGRTYADALNTVTPSATGAVGRVPGYALLDLHGGVVLTRWARLSVAVSNALNQRYFTKRPQFYPGPGIWPSDGRSFQMSIDLTPPGR
jgi:Fe(3+) dicitrate transport protein